MEDEYYAESEFDNGGKGADTPRVEPWTPNVTACKSREKLKWRPLLSPGTPVPTAWAKSSFEKLDREMLGQYFSLAKQKGKEKEVEQLAAELIPQARSVLKQDKYFGKVGAFEGANGEGHGFFRPEIDCTMFTVNSEGFCAVCREAISKAIAAHTR